MLSEKEKKFISLYMDSLNAYKSAVEAGYKCKTESALRLKASRLLKKRTVAKALNEKVRAVKNESIIADKDEVLKFLTKVLRNQESNVKVVIMDNEKHTIINHKYDCTVQEKLEACKILVGLVCQ